MAETRIEWHGATAESFVARQVEKRIGVAAQLVANQVKRNISQAFPPVSAPGEYPHLRTGQLRNSVFWRMDPVGNEPSAIVGVTALHGEFLTEGTANMDPRPFLEPTMMEMHDELVRVVGG